MHLEKSVIGSGLIVEELRLIVVDSGLIVVKRGLKVTDSGLTVTQPGLKVTDPGLIVAYSGTIIINFCKKMTIFKKILKETNKSSKTSG